MKKSEDSLKAVPESYGLLKILRIMKLTTFLLLFTVLHLFARDTYSQNTRLTLDLGETTIEEVLTAIENQSEFYFLFNQKLVDINRKVNLQVTDQKIDDILAQVFYGTNVEYVVIDRQIVLSTGEYLAEVKTKFQPRTITGTVTDENGEPLVGVTVIVKGTTIGAITDINGEYEIEVPSDAETLVFSFVGMFAEEVSIDNQTQISLSMRPDFVGLDEVVVIGYGRVKKSDLTGAVTSIETEEISSTPVARIDQALQGKASGVYVTSRSGEPGTGTSIRIRGGNSISADNEPLYVIDGFIGGGDLNTINASDVASVEILKDASATSIYGTRGANGVILITTKRGEPGKTRVNVNSYSGFQALPVSNKIDLLTGPQRAAYQNEYAELQGTPIPYPDLSEIGHYDWVDKVTRIAPISNVDLSVSGGSEDTRYYLSTNFMNQEGIIKNSGFQRYQFRLNLDKEVFQWLNLGTTMNFSRTNKANNVIDIGSLMNTLTLIPFYQDDGSYTFLLPEGGTFENPIAQYELEKDNTYKTRFLGNFVIGINPLEGLNINSTLGFDLDFDKTNIYLPGALPKRNDEERGGYASVNNDNAFTILNENTINYIKEINGNHRINAMGGITYQHFESENIWATGGGFTNDILEYNRMGTGDPAQRNYDTGFKEWTMLSILGRLNYSLQDKYLLTFTSRYDGSSRLAENHKWAFFPSVAVAWRLSEEPFIESLNLFSHLKLRASYGKSGSQAIGIYESLPTLSVTSAYFNGNEYVGYSQGNLANPDLKWETTNQFDIGFETGFWEGRLAIEYDYYVKHTKDLLLEVEIPWTTGYLKKLDNVGEVENKGMELLINAVPVNNRNFTWEIGLNISGNRNEVLDLGGKEFIDLPITGDWGSRLIVGEPAACFVGATYDGTWKSQEEIDANPDLMPGVVPGAPKFKDNNGNGVYDGYDDYVILGNAQPDFFGGFRNTIGFRNIRLDMYFQYCYGNEIFNQFARMLYFGGFGSNIHAMTLDRWTPENPDSDIPRAGTYQTAYRTPNTIWVQDGSFLRLKTLQLTYNIPARKINWINNASIYFTANNLFLLDDYDWGWDPEVSSFGSHPVNQGFDQFSYPQNRMFIVGVNLEF